MGEIPRERASCEDKNLLERARPEFAGARLGIGQKRGRELWWGPSGSTRNKRVVLVRKDRAQDQSQKRIVPNTFSLTENSKSGAATHASWNRRGCLEDGEDKGDGGWGGTRSQAALKVVPENRDGEGGRRCRDGYLSEELLRPGYIPNLETG